MTDPNQLHRNLATAADSLRERAPGIIEQFRDQAAAHPFTEVPEFWRNFVQEVQILTVMAEQLATADRAAEAIVAAFQGTGHN